MWQDLGMGITCLDCNLGFGEHYWHYWICCSVWSVGVARVVGTIWEIVSWSFWISPMGSNKPMRSIQCRFTVEFPLTLVWKNSMLEMQIVRSRFSHGIGRTVHPTSLCCWFIELIARRKVLAKTGSHAGTIKLNFCPLCSLTAMGTVRVVSNWCKATQKKKHRFYTSVLSRESFANVQRILQKVDSYQMKLRICYKRLRFCLFLICFPIDLGETMFFPGISKSVQNLRSIICHFWSVNPTPSTRCVFPLSMLHIIFPSLVLVGNIYVAAQSLFHVRCVLAEHSDSAQYNFPCCWKYLVSKIFGRSFVGQQQLKYMVATGAVRNHFLFSGHYLHTSNILQSTDFFQFGTRENHRKNSVENLFIETISAFSCVPVLGYQWLVVLPVPGNRHMWAQRPKIHSPFAPLAETYTWQICETFAWFPQTTWCSE